MRLIAAYLVFAGLLLAQQYPFIPIPGSESLDTPQELLQDRAGRLWIGSRGGLHTYDGVRLLAVPGFPKLGVHRMEEGPDGAIWIASYEGLFRHRNGRLERLSEKAVGSLIPIGVDEAVVTMGPPGHEVKMPTPLLRFWRVGDIWQAAEVPGAPGVSTPATRSGDSLFYSCLWPGSTGGSCEVAIGGIAKGGEALRVVRYKDWWASLRDGQGCLWLRSNSLANHLCPGEKAQVELPVRIASVNDQLAIHVTRAGDVLIPSNRSIALGRPGKFQVMTAANGLPNGVMDTIEAQDGSFWIAASKGVYRCPFPFRLEYWNERDGMTDVLATTRNKGRVYAGGAAGLLRLDEDRSRWRRISTAPELDSIWTLSPQSDGTLLAGMFYYPLAQIGANGEMLRRPPLKRSTGARIIRMADGRLYSFGSRVELAKLERGQVSIETVVDAAIRTKQWLDAEQTADGRVFACSVGGLALLDKDGWHKVATEKEGLRQGFCRALAVSPEGNIWYGYNTAAAFTRIRPQDMQMKHFTAQEVRAPATSFLDFDRTRKWLWRGASDGVYVATEAQAEQAAWFHLGEHGGFPKTGANQQAFFEDEDGSVWMGFDTTLVHFQPPPELVLYARKPQVFLSGIGAVGGPLQAAEDGEVKGTAGVVAQLGSLEFEQRDQLRIRYRLLPSTQWIETSKLELLLGPLGGGKHQLVFQARAGLGEWGPEQISTFEVSRSWNWLGWVLRGGGLAAVAWIVWRRSRRPALPELDVWRDKVLRGEDQIPERYEVVRMVSRGGFGTVYEVLDTGEDKARRALKLFHQDIADQEWLARRFAQEVRALESVNHPNIVRMRSHGQTAAELPYLVMDFVDGPSLREIIELGPFPPRRLASLLRQLGSALSAIHAVGIFHRDVKPENVILRDAGTAEEAAILIDFSIALIQDPGETIHRLSRAAGSLAYMPPEQAIGVASPTSDIYSLAIVTIELLVGQRLGELLPDATLEYPHEVRQLLERRFHLSERAVYLLATALDFHPRNRPMQIEEFVAVVADALEKIS